MRPIAAISLLTVSSLFLACGHASIQYQDTRGGVLALHDDEDIALKDAREQMSAHCGARGYQITKREAVPIGQEVYTTNSEAYRDEKTKAREHEPAKRSSEQTAVVREGQTRGTTISGVRELTEHRVTYVCQR
jgi:hypothetical protein